jgi:hypothetical protein
MEGDPFHIQRADRQRTNIPLDQRVPVIRDAEQLDSGAVWIRLQLAAAAVGVGFQPLSQALEEYSEMAEPFAEIHDRHGVTLPGRMQGLFRLGYAGGQPPAPRWPLESRIIT